MASTFGNHSYYCFSFPKLLQKEAWPSSFMVVSTPLIELKLPESLTLLSFFGGGGGREGGYLMFKLVLCNTQISKT